MPKQLDAKWIRISLYYVIALGFSALARLYWHTSDLSDPQHGAWAMYWHLVGGIGPFIGAVVIWAAFRPENRMSFGGTFPAMSVAMLAVPAIVMGGLGISNPFSVDPHLFGIHMGVWIALYAILEETGWRGYLQGEFRNRSPLVRYAIVGLFWYAWHLSYVGHHRVSDEIVGLVLLLLASIGIGFVADRTRSVFAAASFHVIGNIMGLTVDFRTLIPSANTRLIIVLVCVAVWLVMLRVWRMRDTRLGLSPSRDSSA